MARWLVMRHASSADEAGRLAIPIHESWVVLLSTLIVFCVCVSTLLSLCAVRSNPQVVDDDESSVREPTGELAMEPRKMSHRFSGSTAAITKLSASFRISSFRDPPSFRISSFRSNPQVVDDDESSVREPTGELAMEPRKMSHRFSGSTAAITKLSASFRISSFRDPPSFRISSFRSSDCRTQVDVVDGLRRSRAVVEEIDAEPAVWQRAILLGERCAPLSFSGLILYDEHGNPLPSIEAAHEELGDSDQQTVASSRNIEEGAAISD